MFFAENAVGDMRRLYRNVLFVGSLGDKEELIMGINVESAAARANELRGYARQLRNAKSDILQYKQIFGSSWQGTEAFYYISAAERAQEKLERQASELEALGNEIVSVADQIRREEEAAERARREAEERERQRREQELLWQEKNYL